jgi:hypothetical protein
MTRERCALCGELTAADEPDVVEVGGGLAHEDCLAERDDEGLFGEPDLATGRDAASFECSVVELARERRERAARTRRLKRS